ncbi:MAG: hypothetical protein KJ904_03250 [Alphaproteobacteria bacterium]|nr:hypothetical protein [Alphaproteobacteria bacterium]MBU0797893.1 hypothetical protein [Alphaproteobacteria bacterium]MBU0886155.1 hypothetical protein [Alphaproteobacteria bacterium]MBU1812795.1 hypothetical protein [Alphaproteobacteria bacterium]MBU2089937.1 hypothetical protein [Alphaproteobacteria bacterium]
MHRLTPRIPRPDIPVKPLFGIGHNGGPNFVSWQEFCWQKARKRAFEAPREVILMRLRRAQALGMTYDQYVSILLDKGKVP